MRGLVHSPCITEIETMSREIKMSHKELVSHSHYWLESQNMVRVALMEFGAGSNGEIPDVIGFGRFGNSVVVECKVSRSDFLSDKTKPFRAKPELGMGVYRLYACPWGMLKPEEMPEKWGLLYVNTNGYARIKKKVFPLRPHETSVSAFNANLVSEHHLMMNALNRLRYRGVIDRVYEPLPSMEAYNGG